jgi:putative ABC transport system permease protein
VRYHEKKVDTNVIGVTPEFFLTVNTEAASGRQLTAVDERELNNVCVIGDEIRRQLFGHVDPLGETLMVERQEGTRAYQVVGVLKRIATAGSPRRGVEERDINAEIYIPYAAATTLYGDTTARRTSGMRELFRIELTGLYVTADELEHVIPISEMVARILQHNHETLDYEIRVPLRSLQLAERKKRNSQLLLGFIAGISLVVGGIGIMNIMLATVTERTREIGIRRALGARQRHITVQFLIETVVLSTTGGLVGVLLGYTGSYFITRWADWGDARVQPWAVIISFCLSVLVGIGFGLWPALKAARLDPIEALRHE